MLPNNEHHNDNFDDLLRKKLQSFTAAPPLGAFNRIQADLRRRRNRNIAFSLSALLFIGAGSVYTALQMLNPGNPLAVLYENSGQPVQFGSSAGNKRLNNTNGALKRPQEIPVNRSSNGSNGALPVANSGLPSNTAGTDLNNPLNQSLPGTLQSPEAEHSTASSPVRGRRSATTSGSLNPNAVLSAGATTVTAATGIKKQTTPELISAATSTENNSPDFQGRRRSGHNARMSVSGTAAGRLRDMPADLGHNRLTTKSNNSLFASKTSALLAASAPQEAAPVLEKALSTSGAESIVNNAPVPEALNEAVKSSDFSGYTYTSDSSAAGTKAAKASLTNQESIHSAATLPVSGTETDFSLWALEVYVTPRYSFNRFVPNTSDNLYVSNNTNLNRFQTSRLSAEAGIRLVRKLGSRYECSAGINAARIADVTEYNLQTPELAGYELSQAPVAGVQTAHAVYVAHHIQNNNRFVYSGMQLGLAAYPDKMKRLRVAAGTGLNVLVQGSSTTTTDGTAGQTISSDNGGSPLQRFNANLNLSAGYSVPVNRRSVVLVEPTLTYFLRSAYTGSQALGAKPYMLGLGITYRYFLK